MAKIRKDSMQGNFPNLKDERLAGMVVNMYLCNTAGQGGSAGGQHGIMFIIVDSGSTKADWVTVSPGKEHRFHKTEGVNPATQTAFFLLTGYPALMEDVRAAEKIFFYGAGIVGKISGGRIAAWLAEAGFAGSLELLEDMLAAARACCGHHPGIICILGTGSNSCVYDGTRIVKAIPTLGYILSDEGGGVHIGKEVVKSYFYETMPEKERTLFADTYHLTKEELIEKVYRSPGSIPYLASFSEFLMNCSTEWRQSLLLKIFSEFIELRIRLYKEHTDYPIFFVGSIAHYHETELRMALDRYGLTLGGIIRQPVHALIDFHTSPAL